MVDFPELGAKIGLLAYIGLKCSKGSRQAMQR
jgi:hypothetical protein